MQRQILFDGSSGSRCPVNTTTRSSQIGLFRHRIDSAVETLASAPAQDAHIVILQLKDQPAHDNWVEGRHVAVPPTTTGTLGIIDLRRHTEARFEAELDSLHIHLPHQALDDLAVDLGAAPVSHLVVEDHWTAEDRVARQLLPLLTGTIEALGAMPQAYVDHLVLAMATHVATTYGGMAPRAIAKGSLAPWQLKRAQDYLEADPAAEVSLQQVADACGLSVSYFSRAFKASTGMTPYAWLHVRRIERARTLLLHFTLPLADVALRSGFADQSHFTRAFKQATGHTPGAWRRLKYS